MLDIHYCPDCIGDLVKYGAHIHDLYECICQFYIKHGYCSVNDSTLLKFLESKNYIITADVDSEEFVFVRPLGIECRYDLEGHFICAKRKSHVL